MDNPATQVTCVVPTYNRPKLLDRALSSIQSQTRLPYETIVASNGESEAVRECVNKYIELGMNIRLVESTTIIDAWQNWMNGICQVKTKYLKIVWDDDWLEENCLEIMSNWMKDNRASAVLCGAYGHISGEKYIWYQIPEFECNDPDQLVKRAARRQIPNSPLASLLETTDVIEAMNYSNYPVGSISKNLVVGPDFAMNVWAVIKRRKLYFNPMPLVNMFSDGFNMTDSYSAKLPKLYKLTLQNIFNEVSPRITMKNKLILRTMPTRKNNFRSYVSILPLMQSLIPTYRRLVSTLKGIIK